MEEWISIAEYAKIHNVSPDTMRQRILRGCSKTAKKIGRNWVIDKNEIYIDNRNVRGYIYIIKNDVNNKVYIGQTVTSAKERFKQHCLARDSKFEREMKKIGTSHFGYEVLDTGSTIDELCEKEMFYVNKYDSVNNGYNGYVPRHRREIDYKKKPITDKVILNLDIRLIAQIEALAIKENRTLSNYIESLLKKEIEKDGRTSR